MTQLTPHFSLDEFTASDIAKRLGIDNSVPVELMVNAQQTCRMLESVRAHLSRLAGRDIPINISSGYRCPAVNIAVGSNLGSDHIKALAADIKAPEFGTALAVSQALAPVLHIIGIGQLIYEFDSWTHVSAREPVNEINRIITISHAGTQVGVVETA